MFPNSNWLERRLPDIGFWMFVGGAALLALSVVGEAFHYASFYSKTGAQPPSKGWDILWQVMRDLGSASVYNGIVLYLIGRLAGAWVVSIVGFERSNAGDLRLRGPDADNRVWIGRKYDSMLEAEAAANALKQRLEAKP